MKLDYKINNNKHSIFFCRSNKLEIISKSLVQIKSDKNILFIYDSKIDKKIVSDIFYELKLSGWNIIKVGCLVVLYSLALLMDNF